MYHISATNNSIILDGHDRLQASILEQIPPEVITIYQYKVQKRFPVSEEQISRREKAIIKQYTKYQKMGVPKLNDLLLSTFENRPFFSERTSALFNTDSKIWDKEVSAFVENHPGISKVEGMINRESG
ncbi:MAG: hypothetical protein AAF242_06375 [Bacteroidota bacterium]